MTNDGIKYAKDERDRFVAHLLEQYKITLSELVQNPYLNYQFIELKAELEQLRKHPEF